MAWAVRSHSLEEERRSASKEAAPAGLWPTRPSGGRDGAKLADGLWEGGLKKGASGKEAEADGDSHSGCRDGQR